MYSWAGLDQTGLVWPGWTGLAELDRTGLAGLDWIGLDWPGWTGSDWTLLSYFHYGFYVLRFSLGQVWQWMESCWKTLLKTLKVCYLS